MDEQTYTAEHECDWDIRTSTRTTPVCNACGGYSMNRICVNCLTHPGVEKLIEMIHSLGGAMRVIDSPQGIIDEAIKRLSQQKNEDDPTFTCKDQFED